MSAFHHQAKTDKSLFESVKAFFFCYRSVKGCDEVTPAMRKGSGILSRPVTSNDMNVVSETNAASATQDVVVKSPIVSRLELHNAMIEGDSEAVKNIIKNIFGRENLENFGAKALITGLNEFIPIYYMIVSERLKFDVIHAYFYAVANSDLSFKDKQEILKKEVGGKTPIQAALYFDSITSLYAMASAVQDSSLSPEQKSVLLNMEGMKINILGFSVFPDGWEWCHDLTPGDVDLLSAIKKQSPYIADKIKKLLNDGRHVSYQLSFSGHRLSLNFMYCSQNEISNNLNCEVKRSGGSEELITCRHFARGYANGVFGRGKESFSQVGTREEIQKLNTLPDDKKLHWYNSTGIASEAYYFNIEHLPEVIEKLAKKYWSMKDGKNKAFLMSSYNHVMCLRLKKRPGCLKVIFYDPNDTGRHKTFTLLSPGGARNLKANRLLADYLVADYFPTGSASGYISGLQRNPDRNQCEVSLLGDPDAGMLSAALSQGHFGHPQFSKEHVADFLKEKSDDVCMSLLLARKPRRVPGIISARLLNRTQAFEDMMALITSRPLSAEQMRSLFDENSSDNDFETRQCLYWLMRAKSSEMLRIFMLAILKSPAINHEDKKNLITGGFNGSIYSLSVDTISTYVKIVANSDLPFPYKKEILTPPGTFLKSIIYPENIPFVDAIKKSVKNSSLTESEQYAVLTPLNNIDRENFGRSKLDDFFGVFYFSELVGEDICDVVYAYVEIAANSNLPFPDKKEILTISDYRLRDINSRANGVEMLNRIKNAVESSSLTKSEKSDILASFNHKVIKPWNGYEVTR